VSDAIDPRSHKIRYLYGMNMYHSLITIPDFSIVSIQVLVLVLYVVQVQAATTFVLQRHAATVRPSSIMMIIYARALLLTLIKQKMFPTPRQCPRVPAVHPIAKERACVSRPCIH